MAQQHALYLHKRTEQAVACLGLRPRPAVEFKTFPSSSTPHPREHRMMKAGDQAAWRKCSKCNGGDCVEVAVAGDQVSVRDSKDPTARLGVLTRKPGNVQCGMTTRPVHHGDDDAWSDDVAARHRHVCDTASQPERDRVGLNETAE
jgi:hypothetical protein